MRNYKGISREPFEKVSERIEKSFGLYLLI